MSDAVDLGERYRDIYTGFAGVATARTEYVSGWVSVCLARLDKDGYTREEWVHETRLEPDQPLKPTMGFGSQ